MGLGLTKQITLNNKQSVSILSWYNAPISGLDFLLSGNFDLFWNSKNRTSFSGFFKGTIF